MQIDYLIIDTHYTSRLSEASNISDDDFMEFVEYGEGGDDFQHNEEFELEEFETDMDFDKRYNDLVRTLKKTKISSFGEKLKECKDERVEKLKKIKAYNVKKSEYIRNFLKINNCIFIRDTVWGEKNDFIFNKDLYNDDISTFAEDGTIVFKFSKLTNCIPFANKLMKLKYCNVFEMTNLDIKFTKNDKKVCIISYDAESG